MKKFRLSLALLTSLAFAPPAQAGFMEYLSGCMTGMGAGLAGSAFASTRLKDGDKMDTTGYAIAGGLTCLVGIGFVAISGDSADFETAYQLSEENDNLGFQLKRLSKERCLLKETCTPGGRGIIIDTTTEIKKQGDKVFESSTSTIEVNE